MIIKITGESFTEVSKLVKQGTKDGFTTGRRLKAGGWCYDLRALWVSSLALGNKSKLSLIFSTEGNFIP